MQQLQPEGRNGPPRASIYSRRYPPVFLLLSLLLTHFTIPFSLKSFPSLNPTIKMKLTAATAVFSLIAAVSAGKPSGDMTVEEASSKCGNQAQLSCCNEVDYVGDTTTIQKGVASGILSGLLGQGSGAEGIGAFKGCSKLGVAGEYCLTPTITKVTTLANIYCSRYRCPGHPQQAVPAEYCLLRQQRFRGGMFAPVLVDDL